MLTDVLCRFCSLCRVCEAHTEFVASCCDTVHCCCRWCKHECAFCCFCSDCNTGTGCYSSAKHLHSFVKKVIVCIYCLLRVSLIITCVKNFYVVSVESTVCVDFFCCNLCCVVYTKTILCVVTCHRSDYTDLECLRIIRKYSRRHHCCCHSYCCCYSKYFFHIFHNKILHQINFSLCCFYYRPLRSSGRCRKMSEPRSAPRRAFRR